MHVYARRAMPIAILTGAVAVFSAINAFNAPPEKPNTPETNKVQQTLVAVQNIQPQTHRVTLTSQGFVKPDLTSALNSQVAGEIIFTSAKFKLGQMFQKGELIAKIDPLAYEVKLANAEYNLAGAQETLLKTLAKQKIAQLDLEPEKTSKLGLHIPQVATARAKVKTMQWQLKQAQAKLAATQIFAPFTGYLEAKKHELHDSLSANASLGTLVGTQSAIIKLPIQPKDVALLPQRYPIQISLEDAQHAQWQAQIPKQALTVNDKTHMVHLYAEVDLTQQAHKQLPLNAYVTAHFISKPMVGVLKVPSALVYQDQIQRLAKDGTLKLTNVATLFEDDAYSYVHAKQPQAAYDFLTSRLPQAYPGMPLQRASDPQTMTAKTTQTELKPKKQS
jgi:multidrug efflux pump subunit AcrA (membrane-fusion protein)